MSARIREEREHCCDDIAVDVCAEPVVYASALAEIASWRRRDLALSLGAADGALLARVRRILREPEAHTLRAGTGSIALALAILVTAGAVVRSSSEEPPLSVATSNQRIVTIKTRNMVEEFALRTTDHFQLFYQRDLDLHADRVGREAEAAYERISGDLRHNLAKPVPLFRAAQCDRDREDCAHVRSLVLGRGGAGTERSHSSRRRPAGGSVAGRHHARARARLRFRHSSVEVHRDVDP